MDFQPANLKQQPVIDQQTLTEEEAITQCPSCNLSVSEEDIYCGSCGFPLKGNDEEQSDFINNRNYQQLELHDLNKRIKSASTTLYVLAGVFVLSGIFFYSTAGEYENPLALLVTFLAIAAIYVGLAVWTKKQPLPALVSGLVLFVIIQLLGVIQDPTEVFKGIILKVVVIAYLIKGIKSASEAQRIKKEHSL